MAWRGIAIGLAFWALCGGPAGTVRAQDAAGDAAAPRSLTKEELWNQLKTRQAQLALDQAEAEKERARADFEGTEALFKEKIVAVDELQKARQAHEKAVLDFQQAQIELEKTRLEFLTGATLISVTDARKYRGQDGEVMASVTLRNESDLDKARVAMSEGAEVNDEKLASLLKMDNVIVSLQDSGLIGDPYQRIIPELKYGEEQTLEFLLLKRDVEKVTVVIEFLDIKKEYTVFLKKEAIQDLPTIVSTQYAQQGQLGTKVRYDLELERLAKTEQSFSLVVLNLPSELSFAFLDPGSSARITQIKFTRDMSKQSLDLELSVPEKLREELIDQNISFYVLVTRQSEMKTVFELTRKYERQEIPAEELAKLSGNKVNLILIPKGTPKVDLLVANLFTEVRIGEPVAFKFHVVNAGTLALRAVAPALEPPLEWEAEMDPREFEILQPGEKQLVNVVIKPASDASIGEYTAILKCKGHSGIETVEAVDKEFKNRLSPKSNVTSTVVLVSVLIGLVVFIAAASVKVSRR